MNSRTPTTWTVALVDVGNGDQEQWLHADLVNSTPALWEAARFTSQAEAAAAALIQAGRDRAKGDTWLRWKPVPMAEMAVTS